MMKGTYSCISCQGGLHAESFTIGIICIYIYILYIYTVYIYSHVHIYIYIYSTHILYTYICARNLSVFVFLLSARQAAREGEDHGGGIAPKR